MGIRGTSRLGGHGDTRAWGYEGQVDWEGMGIRGHGDTRAWGYEGQVDWKGMGI